MSTVRIANVIVPDIFTDYLTNDSTIKSALLDSGIMTTDPVLQERASQGGTEVKVPFWNSLARTEADVGSDDPNQKSTPEGVTSGMQIAHIATLTKSWSAMALAGLLAGSNPMQRIGEEVAGYWKDEIQTRVIKTLTGIMAANLAGNSDMVVDVANEDDDATTAVNFFTRKNFVKTALTIGDSLDKLTALAVHSVTYGDLLNNDDIDYLRDSAGSLTIPAYLGKRLVLDDSLPVVALTGINGGFKYTSFLFGQGLIGYAEAPVDRAVSIDYDDAAGNGSGQETLYTRKRVLIHPSGFKFTGLALAGQGATHAELVDPTNWERVVERKNVPFAALITNAQA